MAFASIYVPHLMTQAIARAEPALRERAVALVDGIPPLCNVVAANDSALQAGIRLGMSKSQAAQFGAVEIRNRSREQEKAAHAALLGLGWSFSPWIENTAPDTIVLDLTGLVSLFGSDEEIAIELVRRASGLGLAVHVALASKVDVALHAARGFPGITLIPPGEESKRLSRLSVSALAPIGTRRNFAFLDAGRAGNVFRRRDGARLRPRGPRTTGVPAGPVARSI